MKVIERERKWCMRGRRCKVADTTMFTGVHTHTQIQSISMQKGGKTNRISIQAHPRTLTKIVYSLFAQDIFFICSFPQTTKNTQKKEKSRGKEGVRQEVSKRSKYDMRISGRDDAVIQSSTTPFLLLHLVPSAAHTCASSNGACTHLPHPLDAFQ